jgi:hypothetical protein
VGQHRGEGSGDQQMTTAQGQAGHACVLREGSSIQRDSDRRG